MDVKRLIDINCDLGEGMPNDADLMPFISSCNIACGGHYGTKDTIRDTIRLAKKYGVKVGAHPSYPDRENFGRKSMSISAIELAASIREQLSDFLSVCKEEGINPNHVKLHGALYNDCAKDESLASLIREVLADLDVTIPVYTPPNSAISALISNSLSEAFIDRGYNDDGSLVSRAKTDALIENTSHAWKQLSEMYFNQKVTSVNGKEIQMFAETFCIHGDTDNATEIAQFAHSKLESLNIHLDKNG